VKIKNFMSNLFNSVLLVLFGVFMFATVGAVELVFSPATPTVVVDGEITLSVSGASGEITWTPSKGQIQGTSNQVTYIAPAEAGVSAIVVVDGAGNVGTVKITVIPKQLFSLENANWKVFTDRSHINTVLPSDNDKTLWVATGGGLEKYDTSTRELLRVFTSVDGLPNNNIQIIVNDNNNGLWIGTAGGLAHLYSDGKVKAFTTENSELPNKLIESLLADGKGGVWVGAKYGVDDLAHLHANGDWEIFTKDDSGTQNYAYSLLSDGNDGIWIGNNRGLIHFHANKTWTIFNTDNSELPNT